MITARASESASVEVLDIHGRMVKREARVTNAGVSQLSFGLDGLAAGVYFVRVRDARGGEIDTAKKVALVR